MSCTALQALQHCTNAALAAVFVTWRRNMMEQQQKGAAQLQTARQQWQRSVLASTFATWVHWHRDQRDR